MPFVELVRAFQRRCPLVAAGHPQHLTRLLEANEPSEQRKAWEAFVSQYSRLLLGACHRASGHGYDRMMDRYAYVLEQLQRDDYRRLRAYSPDGRTKFTTWLVVVAARLCVDYDRRRYGRSRSSSGPKSGVIDSLLMRRHLADLVAADVDHTRLPDHSTTNPETTLVASEIRQALSRAVANLSPQHQLLLAFRFEHDASFQDISDVMGLPSRFHAYRRLKAILTTLRRNLRDQGFAESGQ